jgi:pyridoxine 5-phosphate synthase
MTKLSVNINKIATLRNARGKNNPNVIKLAQDIMSYGAEGITVHPRPDGRHIKKQDVYELIACIKAYNEEHACNIEFNIEGYPSPDFLDMVIEVSPNQCTLVPDKPDVITSNSGWRAVENSALLTEVLAILRRHKIRSSLFIDPQVLDAQDLQVLAILKPDRAELYTESYADAFAAKANIQEVIAVYQDAGAKLNALGIGLNAGHDLDLQNLGFLLEQIPQIQEVSIGHALICDALYLGLANTVRRYSDIVQRQLT